MASSLEFVQYVAEQLRDAGEITYRKMFGEYGLYCDGKIFALICDDQLFVKITEAGRRAAAAQELSEAPPYEGAKPYFLIEDMEACEFLTEFVMETCRALPAPKPKKPKKPAVSGNLKKLEKEERGDVREAGNKSEDAVSGTAGTGENAGKKKAFDYKKEYKEFYLPPKKPQLIEIPPMNFIAVRGAGDPNEENGAYKRAIGLLYGIAFTIKMSYKGAHEIEGYIPYVVPPLEGLWRQESRELDVLGQDSGKDGTEQAAEERKRFAGKNCGIDFTRKEDFQWISMIRLPEFVTEEVLSWAIKEASEKKKTDFSDVEFFTYDEGLCIQCMHVGPYDDEPETIRKMNIFAEENGYAPDFSSRCAHHEIYLSDPRRAKPERLKTVIRIPVKKNRA